MDFAFLSWEEPPEDPVSDTSLQALISIVQSKTVWVSNIRFLNDHTESLWLRHTWSPSSKIKAPLRVKKSE